MPSCSISRYTFVTMTSSAFHTKNPRNIECCLKWRRHWHHAEFFLQENGYIICGFFYETRETTAPGKMERVQKFRSDLVEGEFQFRQTERKAFVLYTAVR